ncbi:MAG TPA: fasciclin domain-containing protein [Flavobacteriaceae bacterium]|nr:fasciclin domain-containing protein [Flavobacteriaceae bacterium]
MKTTIFKSAVILFFFTSFAFGQTKMVGGAEMYPSRNIIENAVNSEDHTTLVAAVKAAGLVETLKGEGPFTVFAPVNDAFAALPKGTVEKLLQPENKELLQNILTYHVVMGNFSSSDIVKMIKEMGGKAELETVNGETLTAWMEDSKVMLTDEMGNTATVTIADVNQSNGVIHVIDAVFMPKM